jgi:hypothetical protein
MRTLKVWMVVLVMLAVCAPSFGYVLVYNTLSRVKAVDSTAEAIVGVAVRGYMILDINDANGDVNDAYWMVYGRDGEGTKVYTVDGLDPTLTINGRYQSFYIETGTGWFVTVVGKRTNKDIGLAAGRQLIAYTMSGGFIIPDGGIVLNADQFLTGSGSMGVTLNSTKTKAANGASDSLDDTLDDLITAVEAGGYSAG